MWFVVIRQLSRFNPAQVNEKQKRFLLLNLYPPESQSLLIDYLYYDAELNQMSKYACVPCLFQRCCTKICLVSVRALTVVRY